MLVLCVLVVITLICWYLSRRARLKLEPSPYPGSLPLFGHLYFAIRANQDLYGLCKEISYHCLKTGHATLINLVAWSDYLVADPEDALTVVNSCLEKNFMYDFPKPWLGNGLITAKGMVWKQHRKLLNPTFSLQVMYSYMDVFNKQARRLVGQVAKHEGKGRFDHHPYVKKNALETICMTAMGMDLTDKTVVDSNYTKAVNGMLYIFVKRFLTPWLYFDFVYKDSPLKRSQDRCIRVLHNVSDRVIKKWKLENKNKSCHDDDKEEIMTGRRSKPFIELLLGLYDQHGQFTDDEVRKHVDTMIVSGYETVASVLLFTLTLIGSYPRVQDRLYDDLKSVFDGDDREVEVQDLSKLTYLDAVLKESMRVYTVVPVIARYIDKEVKLKKSTLFPGHTCYLSLYGIHRHPVWGEDADEFRPERWLDSSTLTDKIKAFAVFSMGRRNCIGKTYAMMSLKTTLVHFFKRYKVTADHTKMKLEMDFFLRSESGHEISIDLRSE